MTDETKPKKKGRKKQNSSISLPHGRKRTISPGYFTDAALLALSPLHRIFFAGLFCWMDRAGRVLYRPIDLKVRILPMDPFDPVQGLADLEAAGLIRIHEARGLKIISVKPRPWREVQRLHPDEPESALPTHPEDDPLDPEPISDDENGAVDPISVHGNASVDPISGPGSSGSSCLRDLRDLRATEPPLPPSDEGGSKKKCTCTRSPCRHDRPTAPAVARCSACGAGASAEFAAVVLCYGCLPAAEAWAREQQPEKPWTADVVGWARRRRQTPGADPPRLRLVGAGGA